MRIRKGKNILLKLDMNNWGWNKKYKDKMEWEKKGMFWWSWIWKILDWEGLE